MMMIGIVAARRLEGLRRAVAVAALGHHRRRCRRAGDGRMPATAFCATSCAQSPWTEPTISNCGILRDARMDARADLVVDEDAGEAADLEEVAALGQRGLRGIRPRPGPSA